MRRRTRSNRFAKGGDRRRVTGGSSALPATLPFRQRSTGPVTWWGNAVIRLDLKPDIGLRAAGRDTWQALGLLRAPCRGVRIPRRRVERAVTEGEPAPVEPMEA